MKKFLLTIISVVAAFGLHAAQLTPEEALARLSRNIPAKVKKLKSEVSSPIRTIETELGSPAIYIFGGNNSFMLVSADDAAAPLLGYCDSEKFDASASNPEFEWWLAEYARQIQYASAKGIAYASPATRAEAEIAPLVKSHWNQGAPYYNMCPTVNGRHSVTGCVATAMAQVVNYWKQPAAAKGEGIAICAGSNDQLSMNFADRAFDWSNMLNDYVSGQYSQEQADAVAYLMKVCGYSVKMNYSPTESGAFSVNIVSALINNFGYNPNIRYLQRDYFSSSDWDSMVYDEIKAGRPVIYGGQSNGGGHQFIADGYRDGYFHINWGWGGMSDGYFLLSILNPDEEGIGGGAGGYSFSQDILTGVQPQEVAATYPFFLTQQGNMTGSYNSANKQLSLSAVNGSKQGGFYNMSGMPVVVRLGLKFQPTSGAAEFVKKLSDSNGDIFSIANLSGYSGLSASIADLEDGSYKVSICTQIAADENAPWISTLAPMTCNNYVVVTKSGSNVSVQTMAVKELQFVEGDIVGTLKFNALNEVSIKIKNPSDVAITKSITPVLYNSAGALWMIGEGCTFNLEPGQEVEQSWKTGFSLASGQQAPIKDQTFITLKFLDSSSSEVFGEGITTYKMVVVTATALDFEILDAETQFIESANAEGYKVTNPSNIKVKFKLLGTKGEFNLPLYLYATEYGQNTISAMSEVEYTPVKAGESQEITASLRFPSAAVGNVYRVGVLYGYSSLYAIAAKTVIIAEGSGVDDIESDTLAIIYDKFARTIEVSADADSIDVYDVNGCRIASARGRMLEIGNYSGVGVVKVVAGSAIKTFKVKF